MHPIIATHMSMGTVKRLSNILNYLLDFKNNLINIECATLYHPSMTYITVYNLSINSNYRILAAKLNYRFTNFFFLIQRFGFQCCSIRIRKNVSIDVTI